MSDLSQLLNIDLGSISAFPLQANLVNNEQNKRVIEKACNALKRIEEKHLQSQCNMYVPPETLDTLLSKVRKMSSSEVYTSGELKTLAYHLNQIFEESDVFNYALELIEKNWRNRFFSCFVRFVLENWHGIDKDILNEVRLRLITRLKSYSGSDNRYLKFKDHCDLFEVNGPINMLTLINENNIDLFKAPSILGHPESNFHFSYYDDVIVNYFADKEDINLPLIEEVLKKHNSSRTNKLVLADLIIQVDRLYGESLQVDIGNTARRILGDVTNPSAWTTFSGATEEEVNRLKKAFIIINRWCAKQVIQTFFDVCVQAPDRKEFWSKYVKEISDFRIVGSKIIKHHLQSDKRVREHLSSKFIETSSKTNRTAALILFIRNRVFIEFSDIGAVYIYMPDHDCIKDIRSKRFIDSINDLKDRSIGQAITVEKYGDYYAQYGYLIHYRTWQDKLEDWIDARLDLNSDASAFLSSNDFQIPDKPEKKPNQNSTESDGSSTKPKQLTFDDILDNEMQKTDDSDFVSTKSSLTTQNEVSNLSPLSSDNIVLSTGTTSSEEGSNLNLSSIPNLPSEIKVENGPKGIQSASKDNPLENKDFTTSEYHPINTSSINNYLRTNVKIYTASKTIFEGLFRIVIGTGGLYLSQISNGKIYILLDYYFNSAHKPSIWIKKPLKDGYYPIVIAYRDDYQLPMGYIKQANDTVILYKNQKSVIRRITLD